MDGKTSRCQVVKLLNCKIVKLSGAGSVTSDELGTNKFSPCCQDSKEVEEVFLDLMLLQAVAVFLVLSIPRLLLLFLVLLKFQSCRVR